jgi:O-antigen ligase
LFSGLIEYFFTFSNNLTTLYGFITWHLGDSAKPIISGLFNNPNYLSAWLSMILPLGIYSLKKSKKKFEFFFLVIFNLITIALIIFTGSRNGLLAILVMTLFIIKNKKKYLILFLTFLVTYLIIKYVTNFEINIFDNFSHTPRFLIFKESLKLISERPLFGFGAGSFNHIMPSISQIPYIDHIQHTHNLILEVAFNYGLLACLFLNLPIFYILSKGLYINLVKKNNLVDQSWFISFLIISLTYSTDITYYDGRISILSWILLVGLNTINKEEKINQQINQSL